MPNYYESFSGNSIAATPIMRAFLAMMNTGVTFTKCGRKGSPHRRLFKINNPELEAGRMVDDTNLIDSLVKFNLEESYIYWYSGDKVKAKSYVYLK
jgi:hypothetical protein